MTTAVYSPLAERFFPDVSSTRDGLLILGGAALTALCAQVYVPWQPVPFTLQTLAVTLIGLAFGARLAFGATLAYLAAGAFGLPVFAQGMSGSGVLTGTTAGYLIAFPIVAAALGHATECGWTRDWRGRAVALIAANIAILAVGAVWLSQYVGTEQAWTLGVAPFISGAVAKSVIVWALLPVAEKLKS